MQVKEAEGQIAECEEVLREQDAGDVVSIALYPGLSTS